MTLEVARRRKRNKADRIDVAKLLQLLIRYHLGERKVWSVVQVPSVTVGARPDVATNSTGLDREEHIAVFFTGQQRP